MFLVLAALALAAPAPVRMAGPLPFPRELSPEPEPHVPVAPGKAGAGGKAVAVPLFAPGALPFTGPWPWQVSGYMRMLDSDEQAVRDRGSGLLREAGYAALPSLRWGVRHGDAEVRRRCRKLLELYFAIGPSDGPGGEARPMPPIFALCGPVHDGKPLLPLWAARDGVGRGGLPLALCCHWLFLRASLKHREKALAGDWWYCGGRAAEREATAELAGWMLSWGLSRRYVRGVLDDMDRRRNPHPVACPRPPDWMMRAFGLPAARAWGR